MVNLNFLTPKLKTKANQILNHAINNTKLRGKPSKLNQVIILKLMKSQEMNNTHLANPKAPSCSNPLL